MVLAAAGAAYALLAAYFVSRYAARHTQAAGAWLPVTVLKPLHGADGGLERCLETFFRQDYAAPVQIVFGVHAHTDPAAPLAKRLGAAFPQTQTDLVVSAQVCGNNAKVANLANMAAAIRHPVVVVSDSDIAVAPDYLKKIVSALQEDRVGAVSCLYTGLAAAPGTGARLSAMGISYHFLPNVVTGISLGLAKPCMGSTIALTGETLSRIGGFAAFADYLADDYEIGRAVRALGLTVAVPGFAVRHACTETSCRDWFVHELRWMRTIRLNDPAGHLGSIVTHPVPLALLGCLLCGVSTISLWVLGATLAARAVLKWRIDRGFGARSGSQWFLPMRDICAFGVFLASLAGGPVDWQGKKLHVASGGVLSKNNGLAKNRGK